jgi:hypothetical protein
MSKTKAKKADVIEQKSPAEFFAENKNIAGFDNVSLPPFQNNLGRYMQVHILYRRV